MRALSFFVAVKTIGLIALYFFSTTAFAQVRRGIYPSFGVVYQREFMADISIINMSYDWENMYNPKVRGTGIYSTAGIRYGIETNFNSARLLIAPKIAAEVNVLHLTLRADLVDYWMTSTGTHDIRLTPELGFTNIGEASLAFGYNIHLLGNRDQHISAARLSLLFNLSRRLYNFAWGKRRTVTY